MEIPAKVTALATSRDLGAPVGHRDDTGNALYPLLVSAASFATAFTLFYLAGTYAWPLVPIAVGVMTAGTGSLVWAMVLPWWGGQSVYAYERGLVHVRHGRVRAALWCEMERLELHVTHDGDHTTATTSAYLLKPNGQPPLRVRPRPHEQPDGSHQDPFGTLLTRLVADAGRPVVQTTGP
ncbi:hypothetical protein [Actinoplanes subglobosus]|uniref:PH domain-containing protein n=1 Tax=Actinoplanes subglobosus TaxID=1547892 RepID=A0ABV8IZF4_9ACTN